ncbi:MAG: hypothetical protein ACHQWU_06580 [Gemmatimonadales bacterium]
MIAPPAAADTARAPRRVAGRVVRGTRERQLPVTSQWVVLHRVGPDHAGPLDSTRTGADGRFAITYRPSGDTTAIYFVSTSYGGVAYFTAPLRAPVVTGDDASLTVFDTTSGPVPIKIGGRHLIVGAPLASGLRPVAEVFDLQNDSTVTKIAADSVTPVWSTHIPDAAQNFQVNPSGNVASGAISRHGSTVGLFVPLSPGIRQFAFVYDLPQAAFPLSIPFESPSDVVEVMLEEPTAQVHGIALRAVPPVSMEGRTFQRFLGQNIAASSLLRVDVPHIIGPERQRVYEGVGALVVAAMLVALVFAARRARPRWAIVGARAPRPAVVIDVESPSQALVRAIADLDAAFERASPPDAPARAAYDQQRADLKRRLANALAAERQPA